MSILNLSNFSTDFLYWLFTSYLILKQSIFVMFQMPNFLNFAYYGCFYPCQTLHAIVKKVNSTWNIKFCREILKAPTQQVNNIFPIFLQLS